MENIKIEKLINSHVKTTISRMKLYERNYSRDSIEEIKISTEGVYNTDRYKVLIDILTQKYLDYKNNN